MVNLEINDGFGAVFCPVWGVVIIVYPILDGVRWVFEIVTVHDLLEDSQDTETILMYSLLTKDILEKTVRILENVQGTQSFIIQPRT